MKDHKTINLIGEHIGQETTKWFRSEAFDDPDFDPDGTLLMNINCDGGSVYDTLALYDMMQLFPGKIVTSGFGMVASGAVLILAAGDWGHRYLHPNSYVFLHHSCHRKARVTVRTKDSFFDHVRDVHERMVCLLADNTNTHRDNLEKMMNDDTYLTAEKAISYGFADHSVRNEERE